MKLKIEYYRDEMEDQPFITIPDAVLSELGWQAGDDIDIDINLHGDVVLSKVAKP